MSESPCPFDVIAPLLAAERAPPPASQQHQYVQQQAVQIIPTMRREKDGTVIRSEKKLVDPVPKLPKARKRIGVSDERAAEIAEQIARNGQRLGIGSKKTKQSEELIEILDERKKSDDDIIEILDE